MYLIAKVENVDVIEYGMYSLFSGVSNKILSFIILAKNVLNIIIYLDYNFKEKKVYLRKYLIGPIISIIETS